MAKEKKIVTLELDKERHLWFNLNALITVEKETGVKLSELSDGMGLDVLRAMLFAGLKWEDKDLTLEYVGELIDFENMQEIMDKLGVALDGLK